MIHQIMYCSRVLESMKKNELLKRFLAAITDIPSEDEGTEVIKQPEDVSIQEDCLHVKDVLKKLYNNPSNSECDYYSLFGNLNAWPCFCLTSKPRFPALQGNKEEIHTISCIRSMYGPQDAWTNIFKNGGYLEKTVLAKICQNLSSAVLNGCLIPNPDLGENVRIRLVGDPESTIPRVLVGDSTEEIDLLDYLFPDSDIDNPCRKCLFNIIYYLERFLFQIQASPFFIEYDWDTDVTNSILKDLDGFWRRVFLKLIDCATNSVGVAPIS